MLSDHDIEEAAPCETCGKRHFSIYCHWEEINAGAPYDHIGEISLTEAPTPDWLTIGRSRIEGLPDIPVADRPGHTWPNCELCGGEHIAD